MNEGNLDHYAEDHSTSEMDAAIYQVTKFLDAEWSFLDKRIEKRGITLTYLYHGFTLKVLIRPNGDINCALQMKGWTGVTTMNQLAVFRARRPNKVELD